MKIRLKKNKLKGQLIVVEGTDGSGKTTLIKEIERYLTDNNLDVEVCITKQPTRFARETKLFQDFANNENPNGNYIAMQLLTLSDRIEHQHEYIAPMLEAGKVVICDRYIYTSIANMLARGYKNEKWFFEASKKIIRPNLAIWMNAQPTLAIKRILSREDERNKYLNTQLLENVYKNFSKMAKNRYLVAVDANKDINNSMSQIEERLKRIMRKVK